MTDQPAPLTLAEKLAGGCRPQREVPLCLNGELRRKYEAVEARIVRRIAEAQQAHDALVKAQSDDARLATAELPEFVPPADPEQGALDALEAQMRRYVEVFVLEAMDPQEYDQLIAAHPPRKTAEGKTNQQDFRGANAETFNPALIRASLRPQLDDALFAQLMSGINSTQKTKLLEAAIEANGGSDDIPFELSGSDGAPLSDAA